jgi:hypothetical protein
MIVFMDAAKMERGKTEGCEQDAGCGAYNADLFRATLPNRSRHPPIVFHRRCSERFFLPCTMTGVCFLADAG